MSFLFDVIIPRSGIDSLNLRELYSTWGEESFSYVPPIYENGSGLKFVQYDDMKYYKKHFGKFIDSDFNTKTHLALSPIGGHVKDLEMLVNNQSKEISNNKLMLFLDELIKLNSFLIFLIRDEENIDNKYMIHTKEDLVNRICNCLSWSSPEGALLVKA